MQRTRRRLWTRLVTVGASLVIAAAVISGLFQFAVVAVPGYREDLASWVSQVAGRPVRIGGVALTWRGYYPSLELSRIELRNAADSGALLSAGRLQLGFSLARLVTGDMAPSRIELSGVELRLRRDARGRLDVEGLEDGATGKQDFRDLVDQLERFDLVRVSDCMLVISDEIAQTPPQTFALREAEIEQGLLGARSLEIDIGLPPTLGRDLRADVRFEGPLAAPPEWKGKFRAQLRGLTGDELWEPWLAPGARMELQDTDVRITGDFDGGRLQGAQVEVEAARLQGRRGNYVARLSKLSATGDLRPVDAAAGGGWRLVFPGMKLSGAGGAWPDTRLELRVQGRGAERGLELQVSHLAVGDIAPWLAILRADTWLAALHDITGTVRDAQLQWQPASDAYRVRAAFEDVTIPAPGRRVGAAGLSGDVAADESGGRVELREHALQLELPDVFTRALAFDKLAAEAEWRRDGDGWEVHAPRFSWTLLGSQGSGGLDVELPADRSPQIRLGARFSVADATAFKAYMPKTWSRGLQEWLGRGIVAARVPQAALTIEGALADFPFDGKPGRFDLGIEAADARLKFSPDWPAIEGVHANLVFRGNGLTIAADRGALGGASIQQVTASFRDFRDGLLAIDGTVGCSLAQCYEVVRDSPLRETLAGLIDNTQAKGQADIGLHLEIPLRKGRELATSGSVTVAGAELRYPALDEPIRDIRGTVRFDERGVSGQGLTGRLHDTLLAARLDPRGPAGSVLTVDFNLVANAGGKGVIGMIPVWLARTASGSSRWVAQLAFGGSSTTALELASDLQGLALDLPPPLGKPPEAVAPLKLRFSADAKTPLRVELDYDFRMSGDLRFARKGRALALHRGVVRMGDGAATLDEAPGLSIAGTVPQLDVHAWWKVLGGSGLEAQVPVLRRAELRANVVLLGAYALRDTQLVAIPSPQGWRVDLRGTGALGQAAWTARPAGLSAQLEHLALDHRGMEEPDQPAGAPQQPQQLPTLDIDVGKLTVGKADFGHVKLATTRLKDGLQLQKLSATGGATTLEATGEWRRADGLSSAKLAAEVTSTDIAGALKALGYAPNLDARRSSLRASLSWPPAAEGVRAAYAAGTLDVEFQNGQLRAVEPGAGRVLGLINFYALPRRLSLNFRDVVSKGLGFDSITGQFALGDGHARTERVAITGPSLRMEMKGRIGLAARDYDQQVTVYPGLSAGVTLGAVLLGGPAAGAIALVAQEVLNKPLDQVTQLSYRLTGSWDNPKLEAVRGAGK